MFFSAISPGNWLGVKEKSRGGGGQAASRGPLQLARPPKQDASQADEGRRRWALFPETRLFLQGQL